MSTDGNGVHSFFAADGSIERVELGSSARSTRRCATSSSRRRCSRAGDSPVTLERGATPPPGRPQGARAQGADADLVLLDDRVGIVEVYARGRRVVETVSPASRDGSRARITRRCPAVDVGASRLPLSLAAALTQATQFAVVKGSGRHLSPLVFASGIKWWGWSRGLGFFVICGSHLCAVVAHLAGGGRLGRAGDRDERPPRAGERARRHLDRGTDPLAEPHLHRGARRRAHRHAAVAAWVGRPRPQPSFGHLSTLFSAASRSAAVSARCSVRRDALDALGAAVLLGFLAAVDRWGASRARAVELSALLVIRGGDRRNGDRRGHRSARRLHGEPAGARRRDRGRPRAARSCRDRPADDCPHHGAGGLREREAADVLGAGGRAGAARSSASPTLGRRLVAALLGVRGRRLSRAR